LFSSRNYINIENLLRLLNRDKKSTIAIIGVPQDLGASRRGVDMGPSAIRVAGIGKVLESLGYDVHDMGNINCVDIDHHVASKVPQKNLKYLDQILDTCGHLKEEVETAIKANHFPLILGGDHSISIGTLAGMKKLHKGKTGIIWVDAHGDFNTDESTISGNIHGMPLAVLTGRGNKDLLAIGPSPTVIEENSVVFAVRDLDPEERELLNKSNVKVYTMREIDERGIAKVAREAIEYATRNVDHLHVSFDIDSLDPIEAPGTGTRVPGGLTYREAHLLMEFIHESGKLSSLEMVEVNPTLDVRNQTAKLAVDLIASALGKKII
jgi:arginase